MARVELECGACVSTSTSSPICTLPAVGREQAGDEADQRRLAAARAAEQRGDAGHGRVKVDCRARNRHGVCATGPAASAAQPAGAGARAKNSATSRPARPSDSEMSASRAASASPSGVCSAVYSASGSVRVSPGMLDAKVITAPNSPRPAANAVTAPARMPGAISGSVIEKKRSNGPAPSVRAASSRPRSSPLERDADRAHHQRKRHDGRGQRRAGAGERQLDAEVLVQPAADGAAHAEQHQQ